MSSWLDRLQAASWRGYKFLWEQVEIGGGRRVILHEYPFQDDPYAEDMGLKAQEFRLNAYLLGANYDQQALAFQRLLDQKGAGELITPLQGSMQAQLTAWTRTDTTAQGGIARFQLTFTCTGAVRYPVAAANPVGNLLQRRTQLQSQIGGSV